MSIQNRIYRCTAPLSGLYVRLISTKSSVLCTFFEGQSPELFVVFSIVLSSLLGAAHRNIQLSSLKMSQSLSRTQVIRTA